MTQTDSERQKLVTVSREGAVALIHLNRPPANSYNRALLDDLNAAIDEVRWTSEIKGAVIVSDSEKFFCAGADILNFKASTQEQRAMVNLHAHEVFRKMENTPKVFIAAIAGHALGGGLEIALACDFRFAAEGEFQLGLPEVTLGILPGNGGTQRLQRLIGRQAALDMMMNGARVNPTRARELGFVDRLYPAADLVAQSVAYVAQLSQGASVAVGSIKLSTVIGGEMPIDNGLAYERELMARLFHTADGQEGITAFSEKRSPNWTGA